MVRSVVLVNDSAPLQEAVHQEAAYIEVEGRITNLPSLKLSPGTQILGAGPNVELHFKEGLPGLLLSADHQIADLRLVTDETQIALGLADDADDLGTLTINNVKTLGCVHLEGSRAKRGALKLDGIHVERADGCSPSRRFRGGGPDRGG
ncbi:hypothetical protein [Brucella cytisi]|uniref:hypothetical protein n=1 Tax=Brucella cytisi TaxID=407152 RepID=UPI0008FC581E|nr:hypothetical protein [Brucella cytisi]